MIGRRLLGIGLFLSAACAGHRADPREPLSDIRSVSPRIVVDIRYATDQNFTHQVLYPLGRCLLRRSVARRLSLVQADLEAEGLGLKVWDCYRPLSVQRKLWQLVSDARYVADPRKGSRHNRAAAVDATLVDREGRELEMPTGFDDFSRKAHRDYADASAAAMAHRAKLEAAMRRRGFVGLPAEWWHFDAAGWEGYPLVDVPLDVKTD